MRYLILICLVVSFFARGEETTQHFDADPQWIGINNRPDPSTAREVTQDFGYAASTHSGDAPGEIGGTIQPDGVAAYYAKPLSMLDFTKPFSASGSIFVPQGPGNTFLGFFNHATINEWRTPNTLGFRINQRGEIFHVHTEYATSKWRANAGVIGRVDKQADRVYPIEHPGDTRHTFSIAYTPPQGAEPARVHATFDDVVADTTVPPAHLEDGATFDRFGFLNIIKSVDSPGQLWMRDLTINGEKINLAHDPQWDALNNRRSYRSEEVRPRFNFGYSPTHFAAGAGPGEIGGLFYRGDCREAAKLASYGAPVTALSLNMSLKASGKLSFHRGVSDSTTLFGFYHSTRSVAVHDSQAHATPRDFLGLAVEGPSGEGFYVYPLCASDGDPDGVAPYADAPHIYPNAAQYTWSFAYDPAANNGLGAIRLTLDKSEIVWPLPQGLKEAGATFDRIGFVTPWIDGNGQVLYFDDLAFTSK